MNLTKTTTTQSPAGQNGRRSMVPNVAQLQPPAPKRAIRAIQDGDGKAAWSVWRKYLAKRSSNGDSPANGLGESSALLWSAPDEIAQGDAGQFFRRAVKLSAGKTKDIEALGDQMAPWVIETAEAQIGLPLAYESLAWARALPALAAQAEAETWWELLARLIAIAAADGFDLKTQPLESNLTAGELGITLSALFPEIEACAAAGAAARRFLSQSLVDLTDGEGMPHARYLPIFRPLLACWTRCRLISPNKCWKADADNQYRWMITQALRLTRADGRQTQTPGTEGDWCGPLFERMLETGGDDADLEAAGRLLPGPAKPRSTGVKLPSPSHHSEWSECAVLRGKWSRKTPLLSVAFPNGETNIELSVGRHLLLSGAWDCELHVGAELLPKGSAWEVVCWSSDEDMDYLELEMELSHGVKIERSIMLAREDQFLLLADAAIGVRDLPLSYRTALPLADEVATAGEAETCEFNLRNDKLAARVLPLGLPEWRADSRWGRLEQDTDGLALTQVGRRSLFAPLLIDLASNRARRALTWRQLSVGEMRKNVARDVATGHRVQIGSEQWLFYRSLGIHGNRTVLGQNVVCEFLAGRFLQTGDIEELIRIE